MLSTLFVNPLILIVDDEHDLLDTLEYALQREGFRTKRATSGAEALREARALPSPDLIVLDLMLPDLSGTEVCRQLRADPKTASVPVLILSARTEEIDRVVGFELGADDYVGKPFSVRELALRIRALLRRVSPVKERETLRLGRLHLDIDAHSAFVDGEAVALTALEFRLLLVLFQRKGRVQTRERLLADVWGVTPEMETRTVDTHVKRLRQKIGAAGVYVETLRGVGYRFLDHAPEGESA